MIKLRLLGVIISLVLPLGSYGWNSAGHQIVAAIAYRHLQPRVKKAVDHWLKAVDPDYSPKKRFLYASIRPDIMKSHGVHLMDHWHYINWPIKKGGHPHPPTRYNVIWAIKQNQSILSHHHATIYEKGMALTFLIHLVADIHQPLHCASLYSERFKHGDRGGSHFGIKVKHEKHLHQFWDSGLGLLQADNGKSLAKKARQRLVRQLLRAKSPNQSQDLHISHWAKESWHIAKNQVYQIKPGSRPSGSYIHSGRKIIKKRLLLAGWRLAYLLNQTISWR